MSLWRRFELQMPRQVLDHMVSYWKTEYDWRKHEARLNDGGIGKMSVING